MVDKVERLIKELENELGNDKFWILKLEELKDAKIHLHLAVFIEPYLSWIIDGTKVVESRFSKNRCAPFQQISEGDLIAIKKSGGSIEAVAVADKIWSYYLFPGSVNEIRERFGNGIRAEDSFWESKQLANFASLIKIQKVKKISPLSFKKRDRRGWVVLT